MVDLFILVLHSLIFLWRSLDNRTISTHVSKMLRKSAVVGSYKGGRIVSPVLVVALDSEETTAEIFSNDFSRSVSSCVSGSESRVGIEGTCLYICGYFNVTNHLTYLYTINNIRVQLISCYFDYSKNNTTKNNLFINHNVTYLTHHQYQWQTSLTLL